MRIAALAQLQEKAHVGPRALNGGARSFLFLLCTYVFYNLPVSGIDKAQQIQNKLATAASPGPKPKTTTRVRVLQPAGFGYTGANGNEAHQIQNKQVINSSLWGGSDDVATMLHEKCCNTVLKIGAPLHM